MYYEPEDFYIKCQELMASEKGGVAVVRGWTVDRLDPIKKVAYLEDGYEINYKKCLIATGIMFKISLGRQIRCLFINV